MNVLLAGYFVTLKKAMLSTAADTTLTPSLLCLEFKDEDFSAYTSGKMDPGGLPEVSRSSNECISERLS